ncbi:MAG: class I SAM-dependent methyltransferase [Gemmatimonadota bacterium]|nr:class I SAM-dependent methyltransferase [Gemmatimonadota bacterium]
MERYDAYDPIAGIYNRHWGYFADRIYAVLDLLVLRDAPPGSAVLDLCCGTGQLAAVLSEKGYAVTGVDGSEGMIEIARRNAPNVEFLVQDARQLSLDQRYAAVFSTFDSLNHVMSLDELAQVFRNVYAILEAGGCFEFDLNMEEAFLQRWRGSFGIVEDDLVCVARSSRDENERIGRMDLTVFLSEGTGWNRTDVSLIQRWYSETDITERLRSAGFERIRTYDEEDPIMDGAPDCRGRMFFVARKA